MLGDKDVVSLDELVKQYVNGPNIGEDIKMKLKQIPKEALEVKILWDDVTFDPEEASLPKLPKDIAQKNSDTEPTCRVLHTSTFTNNTCTEQLYSYKTSRRTHSTCQKSYSEGYKLGQDIGVKLKVPGNVLELNSSIRHELSLMENERRLEDEQLTWEVESQIRVPPKHRTTAKLTISEKQYDIHFEIKSTIKGTVRVVFKNVTTNKISWSDLNIVEVVTDAIDRKVLNEEQFQIVGDEVRTGFKGICKFSQGVGDVTLTETPLPSVEVKQQGTQS
ncbi:uncharacterized protein LOC135487562 isoform X2 [Lineus longissimus]